MEEGHNSGVAPDLLRQYVERIERLHQERDEIAKDISDIYGEARGNGFDAKIMRKVVAIRRQDVSKRQEEQAILDLYLTALGMA